MQEGNVGCAVGRQGVHKVEMREEVSPEEKGNGRWPTAYQEYSRSTGLLG